jgi:hypothetical protein
MFTNNGTVNLDNTSVVYADESNCNRNCASDIAIKNTKNMTIKNNSIIATTITDAYSNMTNIQNSGSIIIEDSAINATRSRLGYTTYGIYNTGTVDNKNTNITIAGSATAYGIYNQSNNVTHKSGSIIITGTTAYGIYINNGEVTAGIPEIVGSPTYGRDTADVSLTDPLIKAVGATTGIGVKNYNGFFNYYDGRLEGNTAAKPEIPTKVEYLYEPFVYNDTETGNEYCILEWMREQP